MMHLGDPFSRQQSFDNEVLIQEYTDDQEEILDELGKFRFKSLQEIHDQAEIEIKRDLIEAGLLQPEDL